MTKGLYKIEIRKTCKVCTAKIEGKRMRSYCSKKCREKFFNKKNQPYSTEWQRRARAKIAILPDEEKIQCQICLLRYHKIAGHVRYVHKMTARQYKQEFGYDVKRGILSDKARKNIRDRTLENGTMENLKAGKRYWFKEGQQEETYERSEQTERRLKDVHIFRTRDVRKIRNALESKFKSVRQYIV